MQRLGVGLPQSGRHGTEQLVSDARQLIEDPAELPLTEHEQLHRTVGYDRGRAGAAVQEGQFSEVLAPTQFGDGLAASLHCGLAIEDQEKLMTRFALLTQNLPGIDCDLVGGATQRLQLPFTESREEGDPCEVVELCVLTCHRDGSVDR